MLEPGSMMSTRQERFRGREVAALAAAGETSRRCDVTLKSSHSFLHQLSQFHSQNQTFILQLQSSPPPSSTSVDFLEAPPEAAYTPLRSSDPRQHQQSGTMSLENNSIPTSDSTSSGPATNGASIQDSVVNREVIPTTRKHSRPHADMTQTSIPIKAS